ncbi:hypothetical protein BJY04DRAFT_43427 [Aspergillus karnatakaensis]|uniref:GTPase domain-containing protein n=1 Tax=Aspergillus karnatakaensis TaxID=1810916 RepID=UPI003CCDFA3A
MTTSSAEVTARTERCLQSIKSHTDTPARVVFIVGKAGAGKSSLTERIARVTGLSSHVTGTKTCQIVDAEINASTYFIVDTPGFYNEASQWTVFCDIANIFEQIRGHAIIAGILFLTPINNFIRRPDELEQKLYVWLTELCGESFFPNLTFVTTFWEGRVEQSNQRLASRKETELARFVTRGAGTFQFGKKYVAGEETDELLEWEIDTEELSNHARELIIRHCRNRSSAVQPLFLQDLDAVVHRDATSAAQVFRAQSSYSTSKTSNSSQSDSYSQSQQSKAQPQDNPTGTRNQSPAQEESWWWKVVCSVGNIALEQAPRAFELGINRYLGGGGGGGGIVFRRNRGSQAMAESGLDINSSRDTFKFMGIDDSYESRARFYKQFGGPGSFTGSAANGDWLRKEIWRRARD